MISSDKWLSDKRVHTSVRSRLNIESCDSRRVSLCLLLIVSLITPATLVAQGELVKPANPSTLDTLEIVGAVDALPETGDVVQAEHTGSISQISRQRLDQPGTQLSEVLSINAGIQQRQVGGFGTFSSTTIRGASSAGTAVYLDGILLNSAGESTIDLSTLESLSLQSVDIYKGSTPLQLGHSALGGAINLNTLGKAGENKTRLRLGLGSFSHRALFASHQQSTAKWNLTSSISNQRSDNDFSFINDRGTTLTNLDDDFIDQRKNNDAIRTNLLIKGGWNAFENKNTNVLFLHTNRKVGIPTINNTANNNASFKTVRQQLQLSQVIDQWYGWNSKYSLYWHQADNFFDDRDGRSGLRERAIDTDNQTLGARAYWESFINAGTFGLSIDIRNESLDLVDELNPEDNISADRLSTLATSHWSVFDENDKWLLTPALRWETNRQTGRSNLTDEQSIASVDNDSVLGAQLGAEYSITPRLTLSANAGRLYREPSFSELFGSTGLINGNPTLDAEDGVNMDLSLGFQSTQLNSTITVFHNVHDELIVTTFDARGIGRAINSGKAQVTGVELSASWKPSLHWLLSANATFQSPRNLEPLIGTEGKLLPGEAKQAAFARIEYKPSRFSYWYEWQSLNDRFFDSTNLLKADDSSLHSFGLNFSHQRWNISISVRNISDDISQDFNGFTKPGRHGFISLAYSS